VNAGLEADVWSIHLNDKLWVERGAIEAISEAEAHREMEETDIRVRLDLGLGDAEATAWGCDMSRDYVRINASYRT
jgi:glutamate N-acetyltransferase/amino-acid N-acetyltransferase